MRILEEFWYGNIEPTEYDAIACKEYKEVLRLITRNEEKLLATMSRRSYFPGTQMLFRNIGLWLSACCSRAVLSWVPG